MNVQTAAAAGGVVFGLSFLAGLFGGVPFFDILLRALIWGAVGFGGCLGIETVLRNLVPDLFVPKTEEPEAALERAVDITIEEERPAGFVEEEGDAPSPRTAAPEPAAPAPAAPEAAAPAPSDEDMPEIGSFLDAFKPQGPAAPGEAEAEVERDGNPGVSPDYGDYTPSGGGGGSGEVTIDGEAQDPVILAKAIQTVMKRDAQGS